MDNIGLFIEFINHKKNKMNTLNFLLRINKYDNWANHNALQIWKCSYNLRGKYSRVSFITNKIKY